MSIAAQIRQESETRESDRRRRGAEAYRALVKAAAGGKPPAFEKIEQAAAAAGKSVQDFASDVEALEKRIAIAGRLKQIPAQREKLAELKQEIEAHNVTLREAEDRYARAVEPLVAMADGLASQIEQADRLKQELIAGADAESIAAIDAAGEEHLRADSAVRRAQEAIDLARGNRSEQLLADEKNVDRPGFNREQHLKIVANARAATEQLPALQQALVDAEQKYFAAQARQLEP